MKKFIFSIVVIAMFCIGAMAIPKAVSPADMSASVSVAKITPASAVSIDNPAIFNFEAAAIPTDLATAAISINQTNRTATVSRTNPSTAYAKDYSPPISTGEQSSQAIDRTDNDNVPLGSPKPVEATARNGSHSASRVFPAYS